MDSPPDDPPAPRRSRARRLAGLQTGPSEFRQHNHHEVITKSFRIPIQTLQNLLQPSQTSLEAPQSFPEPSKNVSGLSSRLWTPDSRLRTPYSGLPMETRPLQEIIINNHKPKSFSSSVEHPHKDSAWFTKSENNQCEASLQARLRTPDSGLWTPYWNTLPTRDNHKQS